MWWAYANSTLYWKSAYYSPAYIELDGGGYDEYDRDFNLVYKTNETDLQANDKVRQQYGF